MLHLGEPEACIPQGEKGLRLSPNDGFKWSFLAQLGICHLFLNHVDSATDYLTKARAAAPQVWWIPFNLAGALGLKGDLEGGKAALAESLKLKPEIDSIAHFISRHAVGQQPKAHGGMRARLVRGVVPSRLSSTLTVFRASRDIPTV